MVRTYVAGEAASFTAEVAGALRRILGRGGGRCLDVGCGTGVFLAEAQALGWTVTGVDVSRDQLRVARDRLGDSVELLCADGTALPFVASRFDAAYATLIHTDVEDIGAVFGEMGRVLADGGGSSTSARIRISSRRSSNGRPTDRTSCIRATSKRAGTSKDPALATTSVRPSEPNTIR